MADSIQTFDLGTDEPISYALDDAEVPGQEAVAHDAAQTMEHTTFAPPRRRKREERPEYTGEDAGKHQGLVLQACRFGESAVLGSYLSGLGFKLSATAVKAMTIEELETCLERIKVCVLNKGGSSFVTSAIYGISKAAEVIVSKNLPSCPLHGLTEALRKDATCSDLIEHISISRNVGCSSPEMALALVLASTVSRVVAINKFLAARAAPPDPGPDPEPTPEPVSNEEEKTPEPTPPPPGVIAFD
jgi:hypothetical protein